MNLHRTLLFWHHRLPAFRLRMALYRAVLRLPGLPLAWRCIPYTWLTQARLRSLERLTIEAITTGLPGALVECGVAEGGSALLIATVRHQRDPARPLWLCDTFEGLPAPTVSDPDYVRAVEWTGQCRGELAQVQRLLDSHGVGAGVTYLKGLYEDTFPTTDFPPIAVLHLDSDWYEPTILCLRTLWPRVVSGGFVQFDDYGTWQGCKKAVDEFFGPDVDLRPIDASGRWIQKP